MKSKIKISIILNSIIALFVLLASIFMFTGIKFMEATDLVLSSSKLEMFKYFTVDSNLLMGIVSIIFIFYNYLLLKKRIDSIPTFIYILKLSATVGVVLTFLTTTIYLAPFSEFDFLEFYKNSNLFFHLLVPILSFITFVFFEKTNKIKLKQTFYGLIPMLIYAIFYITNVIMHFENGKISHTYDWYGFANNGKSSIIIVFLLMILITYGISYTLWYLNSKKMYKE